LYAHLSYQMKEETIRKPKYANHHEKEKKDIDFRFISNRQRKMFNYTRIPKNQKDYTNIRYNRQQSHRDYLSPSYRL
jgi:hypothetical protein